VLEPVDATVDEIAVMAHSVLTDDIATRAAKVISAEARSLADPAMVLDALLSSRT
jgi:hypothetical protein